MLSTSTWNVDASYKSVKSYREQYCIVIDVVPRPTSSFNRLRAPGASCSSASSWPLLVLCLYNYRIIGVTNFWKINISEINTKLLQTRFNFNWIKARFSLNITVHYKSGYLDKFTIEEGYCSDNLTFYKMLNVGNPSTTNNV